MLSKSRIWGSLASLGFLLSVATGTEAATPGQSSVQTNQFRRIEQPLEVKVVVTAGGIALVGLELWWFLLRKTKAQKAQSPKSN